MAELTGKTAVVLVESIYNEFEFWYPTYRLKGPVWGTFRKEAK